MNLVCNGKELTAQEQIIGLLLAMSLRRVQHLNLDENEKKKKDNLKLEIRIRNKGSISSYHN